MKRKLLGAAAAACLVMAPALAYSQVPTSGTFTATDPYSWRANGTDETTLTVAKGGTVTFEYPAGGHSIHGVVWTSDKKPDCPDVKSAPQPAPWSESCTLDAPGTYTFVCPVHAQMTGTLKVLAPAPTATPTPSPDPSPDPGATPEATPPTQTAPVAQTQNQPKTLTVKLARRQKGTRVRGTVKVEQARSKLEVVVRRNAKRVGRWSATAASAGTRSFAVRLTAAARRLLARKSLKLSVAVALTPPGGHKLSRRLTVRMRG
jgi:plastocyanin